MANVDINLSPYTAESEAISRRMRMAELLQQQAMQPLETPGTAGGYQLAVSPYAGLAKILQGYTAMQAGRGAEAERKALGERYKTESADTLRRAFEAGSGMPERAAVVDPQEMAQMADQGTPPQPNIPAAAPNQQRMAQILMGSSNPGLEALGMSTMQKDLENRRVQSVLAGMGMGAAQTTPGQALNAEAMAGGRSGPTNAAASRIGTPNGGLAIDPLALRLLMSSQGNPTLDALAKAQMSATEPKPVAEGGALVDRQGNLIYARPKIPEGMQPRGYGPGGALTGVDFLPGFTDAQSRLAAIREETKAENEISSKTINGREVSGTNRQWRIYFQGYAPTEKEAQDVTQWATRSSIPASIQFPSTSTGGTPQDSSGSNTGTLAPRISQNPTASESTYRGERAKSYALMADKIAASWEIATKMNGMLDQLDLLYQDPNVASGALAENISGLKGLAASLNIDIKGKGSEEAIQSITNRFALELRNPSGGAGMPGAMSDADRTFLASIPPGLSRTPAGRALIAQGMRAVNDRDRQIATLAQRYEERFGQLDNNFIKEMRTWSDANPLLTPDVKRAMQVLMGRTK